MNKLDFANETTPSPSNMQSANGQRTISLQSKDDEHQFSGFKSNHSRNKSKFNKTLNQSAGQQFGSNIKKIYLSDIKLKTEEELKTNKEMIKTNKSEDIIINEESN